MNARARLIVTIAVAVIVILLAYFLLIRPQQGELSDVRAQVTSEENLTVQLRGQLQRLQALQRDAPKLQAELDQIRDLVPQDHEVPNFIFQVNAAAAASGVELVQLTPELPKQPPEGAQLAQVRITIGGTGGYFAIQDFVRRLYSLDRALRIDVLDLTADPAAATSPGGVTMTATARIFFEAPVGVTGIAPTTPATPVTPTAPPATPAPAPGASPTAAATP